MAQITPGVLDDSGTIIADVHCRRCSYNLRTLQQDGLCPECGAQVSISTASDLLPFSNLPWLDKLAWGALLLAIDLVAEQLRRTVLLRQVSSIAISALPLVGWCGIWLLTAPNPCSDLEPRGWTARRIARWAILAPVARHLVCIVVNTICLLVSIRYSGELWTELLSMFHR